MSAERLLDVRALPEIAEHLALAPVGEKLDSTV